MAITFGGATGWNGASESLRSLRTKEKAADKSPFTPDTPPPVIPFDPRDIERKNYNYKGLGKAAWNEWDSRQRHSLGGGLTDIGVNTLDSQYQQLDYLTKILPWLAEAAKKWNARNPADYPGAYTLAASKITGNKPPELAKALIDYAGLPADYNKTDTIAKTTVPLDPVTAAKIGAAQPQTLTDMLSSPLPAEPAPAPQTLTDMLSSPLPEEPAPAPVDAPKWYEGGDIGVFGGPVQPTEWTDPETGRKYRVEVSARGFGWYPVGFGQLDSPAPPDEPDDGGGYDWWNYSGFGGGGGGGGYSPVSYSNSNWIDRILTNWRINRK